MGIDDWRPILYGYPPLMIILAALIAGVARIYRKESQQ